MTTERAETARIALPQVLFRLDGRVVTRPEVEAWAVQFDAVFVARRARRRALAALPVDEDTSADPSVEATVEEEAAEFRYSRGLESRDALIAWLDARGLTVDGWWEALRRNVLERLDAAQIAPATPPDDEDPQVREAELVVSDLLDAAARRFARRAAVAASRTGWSAESFPTQASRHAAMESEWQAWRRTQLTERALQDAIKREGLAWLVYEIEESHWTSLDAAREAVSCVRLDGRTLADVAQEAGVRCVADTRLLSDVAEALHDAVLTSVPGEVVDPIRVGAAWIVLRVSAKRPPSPAEPLVRAAAEAQVETRVTAPLVESRIVWEKQGP